MATIARAYCDAAFAVNFTAKDSSGTAVNLTGHTVTGWIKANANSTTRVIDLAPTIPTPSNGVIVVSKTDAQMDLDPGRYIFGIRVKNSAGNTVFIIEKPINFLLQPPTS
jgi:hypothetical protein